MVSISLRAAPISWKVVLIGWRAAPTRRAGTYHPRGVEFQHGVPVLWFASYFCYVANISCVAAEATLRRLGRKGVGHGPDDPLGWATGVPAGGSIPDTALPHGQAGHPRDIRTTVTLLSQIP